MNKTLRLFFPLIFFGYATFGQTSITNLFSKTTSSSIQSTALKTAVDNVTSAQLLVVNSEVNNLLFTQKNNYELTVPTKNGDLIVQLNPATITSDDFKVMTPQGEFKMDLPAFYHGKIKGDSKSYVVLTVTAESIEGIISNDKINITLGKLKNQIEAFHIVYNTDDIKNNTQICGGEVNSNETIIEGQIPNRETTAATCRAVEIYLEADYQMYKDMGNSVTTVVNTMTSLFNNVSQLYDNQGVNLVISKLFVWNITDPYSSATSTSQMLSLLDSYWSNKSNTFEGDIVHLVSTKSLGGGVAYLYTNTGTSVFNGMTSRSVFYSCGKAAAKGLSTNLSTSVTNIPTYSWNVEVIAHEIGHNFGLPHTQSCTWSDGTNIGPIDNCYAVENGPCTAGPTPTNGGTIMSYCHLSNVGINFANGFGTLPGGKMLAEFNAATCLTGSKIPPPTVPFTTICSAKIVTITASGCDGGTYSWYNVATAGSVLATGSQYVTPTTVTATTSYYVSCTLNGCTSKRAKATIDFFSNAVAPTPQLSSVAICGENASTTLNASGCNGTVFTWYNASTGGDSLGIGSPFTLSNINSTNTVYVSCNLAGCGATARAAVAINYTYACTYCDPSGLNCSSYPINIARVRLIKTPTTLLDNATTCSANGFQLFTPAAAVNLLLDNTYNIIVSKGSNIYSTGIQVWIDYNQDGIYTNSEKAFQYPVGGSEAIGNILIPLTARLGQTRMRVKLVYSTIPLDPCSTNEGQGYGEIEDYIINLGCATTATYPLASQSAGTYKVLDSIDSQADVANGTTYQAGKSIMLSPGFQAGTNEVFRAIILAGCQ